MGAASRCFRRNAGQLVRAAILGRERVAIQSRRAARDAPLLLIPGITGGGVPWPVVGHRPFDREHAAIVVGDYQIEWLGGIGLEVIIPELLGHDALSRARGQSAAALRSSDFASPSKSALTEDGRLRVSGRGTY